MKQNRVWSLCICNGHLKNTPPETIFQSVQVRIYFEPNNLFVNRIICRFVDLLRILNHNMFILLSSNMIGSEYYMLKVFILKLKVLLEVKS